VLQKQALADDNSRLRETVKIQDEFGGLIGKTEKMASIYQFIEMVAPTGATVLIQGESGVGKELIARAIHQRSARSHGPLISLNCGAIPESLLESELFGFEKGAFTGADTARQGKIEMSDKGTLFLDEVGDIPSDIQPKLLRALQEREFERLGSTHTRRVNIRLIAATNRDLEKMIANREFRSDLFYRLNVFPIRIPPLRERREDIPLLVSYFVQKFAKEMQKKIGTIPTTTMKGLAAWEWPGNIRELENFIERAVILARGESLEAPVSELRKRATDTTPPPAVQPMQEDIARIVKESINAALNGKRPTDEYAQKEREKIVRAPTECNGRVGGADGAAARMGINRTTLISRMKKLGIDPRQYAS
jgi:transcriptional regulator with GAF, ATPase, and Fis domain